MDETLSLLGELVHCKDTADLVWRQPKFDCAALGCVRSVISRFSAILYPEISQSECQSVERRVIRDCSRRFAEVEALQAHIHRQSGNRRPVELPKLTFRAVVAAFSQPVVLALSPSYSHLADGRSTTDESPEEEAQTSDVSAPIGCSNQPINFDGVDFGELYEKAKRCVRYTQGWMEAEDIAQDAMVRVLEKWNRLRNPDAAVRQIASNLDKDAIRRKIRGNAIMTEIEYHNSDHSDTSADVMAEQASRFQFAIETIASIENRMDREVLIARLCNALPIREAAAKVALVLGEAPMFYNDINRKLNTAYGNVVRLIMDKHA